MVNKTGTYYVNLAAYRTRLTNSLNDTTTKYSNSVLDEALRKILSEYTRAFQTSAHRQSPSPRPAEPKTSAIALT